MNETRMRELLNQIVDWVAITENTNGQITKLLQMGFAPDELVQEFQFSEEEVQDCINEEESMQ